MRFLNVFSRHHRFEVDFSNGLRDTDDCLKLAHGNRNSRRLLVESLVLRGCSILDVKILEHVASLLTQLRLNLKSCVADVLAEIIE